MEMPCVHQGAHHFAFACTRILILILMHTDTNITVMQHFWAQSSRKPPPHREGAPTLAVATHALYQHSLTFSSRARAICIVCPFVGFNFCLIVTASCHTYIRTDERRW